MIQSLKHTLNDTLVGVKVQGEHHVVLLDDTAGSLLDSLCADATHGGKVLKIRVSKIYLQKYFCSSFLSFKGQKEKLLLSGTAASTSETESGGTGTAVGVLLTAVGVAVVGRVGGLGNTNASTTTGLVVDDLGLLLHGDGDDLWWKVEVLTEVLNTLIFDFRFTVIITTFDF